MTGQSQTGSRLDRVAAVESQRRTQAGSNLAKARRDLDHHQQRLQQAMTQPQAETPGPASGSAAAMLAGRQAVGRMVDRLINDTIAHNHLVAEAEEAFRHADRRSAQMERAVELALERQAIERRKALEKQLEDTVIAVSTHRDVRGREFRNGELRNAELRGRELGGREQ